VGRALDRGDGVGDPVDRVGEVDQSVGVGAADTEFGVGVGGPGGVAQDGPGAAVVGAADVVGQVRDGGGDVGE